MSNVKKDDEKDKGLNLLMIILLNIPNIIAGYTRTIEMKKQSDFLPRIV